MLYQKKKTTTRVPIVVRVADRKIPGNTFQTVYRITAGDETCFRGTDVLAYWFYTLHLSLFLQIKHYIIMLQIKKINKIMLVLFFFDLK